MRASYGSRGNGYAALIFLGSDNKGVDRLRLPFQPRTTDLGSVTTDTAGHFSLLPSPDVLRSNPRFRVDFAGNNSYRLSSALLP